MASVFVLRVVSSPIATWPVGSYVTFDPDDETPYAVPLASAFLFGSYDVAALIREDELDENAIFAIVELSELS